MSTSTAKATQLMPRATIALGVTGGIGAFKTVELARLLVGSGYRVLPIMTEWASRFVGPLTFETLTANAVRIETPVQGGEGIEHISLVRAADLLVIAPLTANTLAKMANGLADNFLTTAYLAHRGPTLVCPAMNTAMLEHPATQRNLARLAADGVWLLAGAAGDLACGETGAGRMAEPTVIFDEIQYLLGSKDTHLAGKMVLVSAGPTFEDLDPVRFLANRSSGKMGIALARAFRDAGAQVVLVHGPIPIPPLVHVQTVGVRSASEMASAILDRQDGMDLIVMAAAVADYRPPRSEHKLKKQDFDGILKLEPTTDILAELGRRKVPGQVLVGFAAETRDLLDNARAKLDSKNLDFVFANNVAEAGSGFSGDTNRIIAIGAEGEPHDFGILTKDEAARQLVEMLAGYIERRT